MPGNLVQTNTCTLMSIGRPVRERVVRALGYAALAATSVLVVVLARQNAEWQQEVRRLRIENRIPHAGHVVPAFRSLTLAGDSVTVGEVAPGERQLLMIFNTECPYCLTTLPYWEEIVHRARQEPNSSLSVYGISLDSADATRRYVSAHQIGVPVLQFPDARTAGIYRAIGVPMTIIVGEDGKVLYGRAGELTDPHTVDSVLAVLAGG